MIDPMRTWACWCLAAHDHEVALRYQCGRKEKAAAAGAPGLPRVRTVTDLAVPPGQV